MKSDNPQVPLEAVLKYIKKDRDSYKEKLERLIPYAKSLEQRVKALTEENDSLREELAESATKKEAVCRAHQVLNENEMMREELKAFRTDYRQTAWYKQIEGDRDRLRKKNGELQKVVDRLLSQLAKKDD